MPEWLIQVIGMVGAAAGIYAAIRADLAYLRAKAEDAHTSATLAHARIDRFLEVNGIKGGHHGSR